MIKVVTSGHADESMSLLREEKPQREGRGLDEFVTFTSLQNSEDVKRLFYQLKLLIEVNLFSSCFKAIALFLPFFLI